MTFSEIINTLICVRDMLVNSFVGGDLLRKNFEKNTVMYFLLKYLICKNIQKVSQ